MITPPPARVVWILWGAMFVALANYVLLSAITLIPVDPSMAAQLPTLAAVFSGVAAVNAACSLFLAPVLGRMFHSFWIYFVLRLLFAESIAILGLVLLFLGEPDLFMPFVGVSAALLLLAAPTAANREAILRRL
jgi:hypothetical protein